MAYLIVGLVELTTCITIIVILVRPLFESASRSSSYFIPIYALPVCFLLVSGLALSIESIMQMFHVDVVLLICNWFLIRALSEAAIVFLMQHGIGRRSAVTSATIGLTWSMICGAVLLLSFYFIKSDIYWLAVGSVILLLLTVTYAVLWLLPLRVLHRRPACSRFAMLTFALTLAQFVAIAVLLGSPRSRAGLASSGDASSSSERAVMLVVAVTEFAQVLAVLHALHVDSLFWQGLHSDASANLNHPLAGAWDNLQSGSIQAAVRHTISSLERRVVPIIPYSHLAVDTGNYFSGGSARVYRGRLGDQEVAVKILFCIELTPARVVDFCNEATLLNSLRHPNVVRCCGVSIMPPAIALVTEFCAYGSLYDFLHSTELHLPVEAATRLSDASFSDSDSRASGITRGSMTAIPAEDSERLRSFAHKTSLQNRQSLQQQQQLQTERGDSAPDSEELVRRSTASSGQFSVGDSSVHRLSDADLPRPGSGLSASHSSTGFLSPASTVGHSKFSFYGRSGGTKEGPHLAAPGAQSPATDDKDGLTSPLLGSESGGPSAGPTSHALRSPSRDVGHSEQWAVAAQLAAAMTSGSMSRAGGTGEASSSSRVLWGAFGGDGGEEPLLPSYSRKQSRDGLRRKSSRMLSASRVLASSEMGFGLGPRLVRPIGAQASSRLSQRRADGETRSRQPSVGSCSRASSTGRQSTTSASALASVAAPSVHSVGRLLPASTRLRMARECCAGLAFLHSEGLLHCDVKSLNFLAAGCPLDIVVTADLTVKLADLGETRLAGRGGASPADTRDIPLNINWSSPELLRRHCTGLPGATDDTTAFPVTQASDVWSLAMVVAELLSGEVPFDSPRFRNLSLPEFAELITETGMRPAIPSVFAQLPWLSDLLDRAWSADPAARCTAAHFLDTFDANLPDI